MTTWLRKNWQLALFNVVTLGIMISLLAFPGKNDLIFISNPFFENCGKWAIRFLLISLSMTPLNTVFGWRGALKLRKSAGLWAFGFGVMHLLAFTNFRLEELGWRVAEQAQLYVYMGVTGLSILALMAITSNRWAMRWLGKSWKRLHRMVYAAGALVTLHAVLGYSSGKKFYFDPDGVRELHVYVALLVILLALRLPLVKRVIQHLRRRRPAPAVRPVPIVEIIPNQWDDVSWNQITIASREDDPTTTKEEWHEFV